MFVPVDLQTCPNPCRWVFIRLPLKWPPEGWAETLSRSLMQTTRELGLRITKPWVLSAQSTYCLGNPPASSYLSWRLQMQRKQQLAWGREKGWKDWSNGSFEARARTARSAGGWDQLDKQAGNESWGQEATEYWSEWAQERSCGQTTGSSVELGQEEQGMIRPQRWRTEPRKENKCGKEVVIEDGLGQEVKAPKLRWREAPELDRELRN